jgi:transmembrane sensor
MNVDSREHKERVTAAADWLLRLRNPAVTPVEIAEWLAWCNAEAENKIAFTRMQSLWQQSAGLPSFSSPLWRESVLAPARVREGFFFSRRSLALAAAILLTMLGTAWLLFRFNSSEAPDLSITAHTGINREVVLPDGSAVTLAGGSRLATHFTNAKRDVFLETGEAYFKVEKDRSRPFVVHALEATVTAVGTAFNVRAEQGVVRVAVTEGTVDIDGHSPENIRLRAGHEVTLARDEAMPVVVSVDVKQATAWVTGTLRFVDEPLASVVAAVNRYSSVPVTLEDARLAERRYTGTVVADRIDEWLRGLPDVFPVVVADRGAAGVSIRPVN